MTSILLLWETWRDKWGLKAKPAKRCACGVEIGTQAAQCSGCHDIARKRLRRAQRLMVS